MTEIVLMLLAATLSSPASFAIESRCVVTDFEDYYNEEIDEQYEVDRAALAISEGLFRGPLMRGGGQAELSRFQDAFTSAKEMEIGEIQELIRIHLYDDSREFRDQVQSLENTHGRSRAAERIRDSIYTAYGYTPERAKDAAFDACLVEQRQAHFVVARAIVDFMERRNLD